MNFSDSKSKQWLDEIQSIHRMLIRETVFPFDDKSPDAKRERLERARTDHKFFMKTYLPQYFSDDFAPFHEEMLGRFETRGASFSVFAGPREHAKSTLRMGYMLHQGVFGLRHFQVITSQTEDTAVSHLIPLKIQFEENQRIINDFGNLIRQGWWESWDFALASECRYLARGIDQPHRGILFFQHRMDFIGLDDVEDKRNTRNPKICKERAERVKEEIYGSLDRDGTLAWIGNWIRNHSALALLIKESTSNKSIFGRVYRAETKGKLLWPGHWTHKQLEQRRRVMGTVSFNREFQNMDSDPGTEFPEENLKYYRPSEISGRKLQIVSYGDPAGKGLRTGQSYHTWETWGLDKTTGIFYCLNAWIKHVPFPRWVEAWFTIYREFGGRGYFEAVGAQTNYKENFKPTAIKAALPAPQPVEVHKAKEDRIVDLLSPLWEEGRLRFIKGHSDQDLLVEQFLFWGATGVEKDGPDAAEGAVRKMKKSSVDLVSVLVMSDADEDDDYGV
jgi:hypothetical protein